MNGLSGIAGSRKYRDSTSIRARALAPGTIWGQVSDALTGDALPGADVYFPGAEYGSATDLCGVYLVTGVPPGEHEIYIAYLGYENERRKVFIGPGSAFNLNIKMQFEGIQGEWVTVTAQASHRTGSAATQTRGPAAMTSIRRFETNPMSSSRHMPGASLKMRKWDPRHYLTELAREETENYYAAYLYNRIFYAEKPEFFENVANFFREKGLTALAQRILSNYFETDRWRDGIWSIIDETTLGTHYPDLAVPILEKSIELSPLNPVWYLQLAKIHTMHKRYEEAAKVYCAALQASQPFAYRLYPFFEILQGLEIAHFKPRGGV